MDQPEKWDVVIEPQRGWWRMDLSGVWHYRDLLLLLVRRDLLAVYKQTLIGPAWQVLQPLLTSLMFAVIFGIMARMSPPGIPALLFYMSAVVPWGFFSGVITRTSQTLVWNAALMTKVYFPRLIAPLATTLATGFNFMVQLAAFLLFAIGFSVFGDFQWHIGPAAAMLPILILIVAMLSFGIGIIVAALTTRYRDLTFIIGFAVQLLMYASPVIFPLSRVPSSGPLRGLLELNPMTPVIEGFRAAFFSLPMDWSALVYSVVVALVSVFLGLIMFQRVERTFADVV